MSTTPSSSVESTSRYFWRGWIVAIGITISCAVVDQATKYWAHSKLRKNYGGEMVIVPDYFSLSYVRNPGAAWGFLAATDENFRKPFFKVVSIVAIVFIGFLLRGLRDGQWLPLVGLALVLSGAVGNLIDRFLYGYVIDFLNFHLRDRFRWPTFNVADVAISVGVGLIILDALIQRRHRVVEAATPQEPAQG